MSGFSQRTDKGMWVKGRTVIGPSKFGGEGLGGPGPIIDFSIICRSLDLSRPVTAVVTVSVEALTAIISTPKNAVLTPAIAAVLEFGVLSVVPDDFLYP